KRPWAFNRNPVMLPAPPEFRTYTRSPCCVTLFGKPAEGSPDGLVDAISVRSSPRFDTRNTDTSSLPKLVTNSQRRSWLSSTECAAPRPSPAKRIEGPEPCPPVLKRPRRLSAPSWARLYIRTWLAGSSDGTVGHGHRWFGQEASVLLRHILL